MIVAWDEDIVARTKALVEIMNTEGFDDEDFFRVLVGAPALRILANGNPSGVLESIEEKA